MKKFLILSIIHLFLYANESIYIDAKLAIQMIEKRDVTFISAEKIKKIIRGSKLIDTSSLFSSSVLGNMPCSPLYSCPSNIERKLTELGVKRDNFLVLYDKSYGVYASTLYSILESIGHKNMSILNGGAEAILKIDPNQKLYDKYMQEISNLTEKDKSVLEDIKKKLDILKPHLLVQKKYLDTVVIDKNESYQSSKLDKTFLLSSKDLRELVTQVQRGDKNVTIVDTCPMVDIVGNRYGNYEVGVSTFNWKKVIDIENKRLKSKEKLTTIFNSFPKEKQYALYCMENSNKALFLMTVMRYLGYNKVKAFTGNWSVWTRGKDEE